MIKVFETESGSRYTINFEDKTWKRERGENANVIRSDQGTYREIYFRKLYDGLPRCIVMICPPFEEGSDIPRYITSTPIMKGEEILQCQAVIHHGPGHQSTTKCGVKDFPHTLHAVIYGSYREEASWYGDEVFNGYFDEPPQV